MASLGQAPAYSFDSIDNANLNRLAAEWPDEVANYLRTCIEPDKHGSAFIARTKVGLASVDFSTAAEPSGLIAAPLIAVRPLSFWVTDKFNYGIARGDCPFVAARPPKEQDGITPKRDACDLRRLLAESPIS